MPRPAFAVVQIIPQYDGRDAFYGNRAVLVDTACTEGFAHHLVSRRYRQDGEDAETSYEARRWDDARGYYAGAVHKPAPAFWGATASDELPF